MWGTILGLVSNILGMFSSNKATDEFSSEMEKMAGRQRVPPAAIRGQNIMAETASMGLPGYETMKSDILSQIPMTLNQAKDYMTGGQVVDFLSKAQASTNQQLRQLSASDEAQKLNNRRMYAEYLGKTMAGWENNMTTNQNQILSDKAYMDFYGKGLQTNYTNSLLGSAGSLLDSDWSKIIALLSKNNTLDFSTYKNYGIQAGPTESSPTY